MRLILFLFNLWLLYILFRFLLRYVPVLLRFSLKTKKSGESLQEKTMYDMVPCSICGAYVIKSAAIFESDKIFCSQTCRTNGRE